MAYTLAPYNGDTLPVPQIVLTHLAQADGDTVRTALYVLQTGDTDPRTIARTLGLPSIEAARRALQAVSPRAAERPAPQAHRVQTVPVLLPAPQAEPVPRLPRLRPNPIKILVPIKRRAATERIMKRRRSP